LLQKEVISIPKHLSYKKGAASLNKKEQGEKVVKSKVVAKKWL